MTEAEVNHPAPNLGRRSGVHPTPPTFQKNIFQTSPPSSIIISKKFPFPLSPVITITTILCPGSRLTERLRLPVAAF